MSLPKFVQIADKRSIMKNQVYLPISPVEALKHAPCQGLQDVKKPTKTVNVVKGCYMRREQ